MTKPKIANNNCLNPIARLSKRMDDQKRRHNNSISRCNNFQEAHNKASAQLKETLERKSKLAEGKTKKKRAPNPNAANRKKAKLAENQQKVQNNYFTSETNHNVTLNIPNCEVDSDLDQFVENIPSVDNELERLINGNSVNFNPTPYDQYVNEDLCIKKDTYLRNIPYSSVVMTNHPNSFVDKKPPVFPPPEHPPQPILPQYSSEMSNGISNNMYNSSNYQNSFYANTLPTMNGGWYSNSNSHVPNVAVTNTPYNPNYLGNVQYNNNAQTIPCPQQIPAQFNRQIQYNSNTMTPYSNYSHHNPMITQPNNTYYIDSNDSNHLRFNNNALSNITQSQRFIVANNTNHHVNIQPNQSYYPPHCN